MENYGERLQDILSNIQILKEQIETVHSGMRRDNVGMGLNATMRNMEYIRSELEGRYRIYMGTSYEQSRVHPGQFSTGTVVYPSISTSNGYTDLNYAYGQSIDVVLESSTRRQGVGEGQPVRHGELLSGMPHQNARRQAINEGGIVRVEGGMGPNGQQIRYYYLADGSAITEEEWPDGRVVRTPR